MKGQKKQKKSKEKKKLSQINQTGNQATDAETRDWAKHSSALQVCIFSWAESADCAGAKSKLNRVKPID